MITRPMLRALRNDLPMPVTLQQLGDKAPYSKSVEGRVRFVCPHCGELLATVNPRNNLAHCFSCCKNINNIDLMIELGYHFSEAIPILQEWLRLFRGRQAKAETRKSQAPYLSRDGPDQGPQAIGDILRCEFGNAAEI